MIEPEESLIVARAKRNFAAKGHGDRAWETDDPVQGPLCGGTVMVLSQAERDEYVAQARHELRNEPAS
ncbi:hypothetical protein [uncultured Methylobacterium sp.]|uniref:hypothetical protein n=1 Tax=uncultured Methylobacterium sp. TaxID=157278 RepID=UPI0035CB46E7